MCGKRYTKNVGVGCTSPRGFAPPQYTLFFFQFFVFLGFVFWFWVCFFAVFFLRPTILNFQATDVFRAGANLYYFGNKLGSVQFQCQFASSCTCGIGVTYTFEEGTQQRKLRSDSLLDTHRLREVLLNARKISPNCFLLGLFNRTPLRRVSGGDGRSYAFWVVGSPRFVATLMSSPFTIWSSRS